MKPLSDESKIRARVFDVIRRIVDIPPITGAPTRNLVKGWLAPPDITKFKGIDPVLLYGQADEWFFHPLDCTPIVEWPIDVCLVQAQGSEEGFGLVVQRISSVTPKQVRGHVSKISPFMLRRDIGAEDRGKFITASCVLSYLGGGWVDSRGVQPSGGREGASFSIPINNPKESFELGGVAIAVALRHRYEWAVNIGFEKSPSVRILTDPTGMKELFRLRDVPDGRDRRDALMTWVSDHWRKDRKDADVETYVRKHLRGSTKFEWRGMECEIAPAAFDVEQRDKLMAERSAMRRDGEDKRKVTTHAP